MWEKVKKKINGHTHILVVVDALTKFVTLYPVESTRSNETIRMMQRFVDTYGLPRRIISDRGTCFTSEDFGQWCESLGIKHTRMSSRWPQANGQVERVMRTLVPTIVSSIQDETHWDDSLLKIQRNLNSAKPQTLRRLKHSTDIHQCSKTEN